MNLGTTDKPLGWTGETTTGTITGRLWDDTNGDGVWDTTETATGVRTVFIDTNRNGKLDSGEVSTTSDAAGNYTFAGLAAGTYYINRVFPSGYRMSNSTVGYLTVTVTAGQTTGDANIGTTNKPSGWTGGTTGGISGTLWDDKDKDGVWDANEVATGVRTVFIDTNGNNKIDAGELTTSSDSTGKYVFSGLVAGTYKVTRSFPSGYKLSNGTGGTQYVNVTVGEGAAVTGVNLGSMAV
ncbi:MAG: SdrD B-like domain-containing protein [Tepidisphaeraceae bacterium]